MQKNHISLALVLNAGLLQTDFYLFPALSLILLNLFWICKDKSEALGFCLLGQH